MSEMASELVLKARLCDALGIGLTTPDQHIFAAALEAAEKASIGPDPVPMLLTCPSCGVRHIDEGRFATKRHHTHACQECGMCWRPAVVATCGVRFLPGFKNEDPK